MKKFLPTTISILFFLIVQGFAFSQNNGMSTQSVQCDQTTNGGVISSNEVGVLGGFDPTTILSTSLPTGGTGTIEYKWYSATIPSPYTDGNLDWTLISGANSSDYDPGFISQTEYFVRVSKRNTCNQWGEVSNMVRKQVPSAPINSCLVYAVQDKKSSDFSQFFTVDVFNGNTVTNLGPRLDGWDIEGMEADPITHMLYGTSGNDNEHGFDGHFYTIDAITGTLNLIGPTGYDDVVSLAFNPVSNVLYAWVDDYGLITINLQTGAGTMVYSSPLDFDGMAWSNDGSILYVATDDKELSTFDPVTGNIVLLTNTLPGPVESLEMRPDGNLMFATHLANTTIFTINPQTLNIISASNIITPYNDIESIVWPDWCSLSFTVSSQNTDVLCYGGNTGTATISVTDGLAPYTYIWSDGNTQSSSSSLVAGNYSVTVTDVNGVTDSVSFVISEPSALNITKLTTQATCAGNLLDGSITINVTGGVGVYTYSWSTGSTAVSIDSLVPGS
jgi:hypothetical protein